MQAPCPLCRHPFQTPTKDLPANFVVQNVIAESLRSSEGLCQDCCAERKLELATARCRDCHRTLCDSCGTEHADRKHELKSLVEKKCDEHQRKLELICLHCEKNICVICFSEDHQDHKCDAVDKVAEQLSAMVKADVEELDSSVRRLRSVFSTLMNRKRNYERQVAVLNECLDKDPTGQRTRAAKEAFQLEKRRKGVESFMRTKQSAIKVMVDRDNNGKAVDFKQVRHLACDISVLVVSVIFELGTNAARLRKLLSDMDRLKTTASDIMLRSASKYDMAENKAEVTRLHDETQALLHTFSIGEDPYLTSVGNEEVSAKHDHNL